MFEWEFEAIREFDMTERPTVKLSSGAVALGKQQIRNKSNERPTKRT